MVHGTFFLFQRLAKQLVITPEREFLVPHLGTYDQRIDDTPVRRSILKSLRVEGFDSITLNDFQELLYTTPFIPKILANNTEFGYLICKLNCGFTLSVVSKYFFKFKLFYLLKFHDF